MPFFKFKPTPSFANCNAERQKPTTTACKIVKKNNNNNTIQSLLFFTRTCKIKQKQINTQKKKIIGDTSGSFKMVNSLKVVKKNNNNNNTIQSFFFHTDLQNKT